MNSSDAVFGNRFIKMFYSYHSDHHRGQSTVKERLGDADRDPERSPANIVYLNGRYSVPFRSGAFNIYLGYT